MKNILLIGDSIRMGYDKAVQKALEGKANVYFPEENCRFAAYLLRNLHEYKNLIPEGDADVIHWNAGLWDCQRLFEEEPNTPVEIYAYYIERICRRIKKVYPNARVIFATSTCLLGEPDEAYYKRYNEDVEKYNETAVAIMEQYGIAVNDLHALSKTLPKEAHSDPIHYYTPLGTEAFADQVLSYIMPALELSEERFLRRTLVNSYLGRTVKISIDRPLGSTHPEYGELCYPVNYGFIPNVLGNDGEEQDVYLLGVEMPVKEYTAQIIGIVHRHNDIEDKLIAAPVGTAFTAEEVAAAVAFQERYYDSEIQLLPSLQRIL